MKTPETPTLAQAFLEAWVGSIEDVPADLEDRLAAACSAGRDAWPGLPLPDTQFVRHLAACVPSDATTEALAKLYAVDLYLACACADQLPAALALFDRQYIAAVPGHVKRFRRSSSSIDDVPQIVRTAILVGIDHRGPRIRRYKGRGSLGRWVQVVAERVAQDLLRRDGAHDRATTRAAQDIIPLRDDPGLDRFKHRYREQLKAAFHDAVGTLSPRQRVLLKLHVVDRLSHERIGTMYRVHQVTATRWIDGARQAVAAEVGRLLCQRLGVSAGEVTELFSMVQSQLDLSLTRVLGSATDGDRT